MTLDRKPEPGVASPAVPVSFLEDEADTALFRRVTWRLIPFLMICYVTSYLDRVNVGFAKLQMLDALRFSETTYGIGAGVFFIGYTLCCVPSNLTLRKVGARKWIAILMVTWGLLSSLGAFVTSPTQFYVLRFLLGAAEAGFNPGVILYLTFWFPNGRRARVTSIFQTAIPVAGILGGPLSGWILDHMGAHLHFEGWQWLFLIEAVPAVLLGLMAYFWLNDGIDDAGWLTQSGKERLKRHILEDQARQETASLWTILLDPRVWRLSLLLLGLVIGIYAVSFWAPTLLKETGLRTNSQIGWVTALSNLVAVPVMFLFARSSDLRQERRWHVACAALLGAAGLALGALFSHDLPLVVIALALATAGLLAAVPMQWSIVTALLGGSGGAAAIGVMNSISSLGGLISPPLLGWLKETTGSLEVGLGAIALCAVISAVLALTMPARPVNK